MEGMPLSTQDTPHNSTITHQRKTEQILNKQNVHVIPAKNKIRTLVVHKKFSPPIKDKKQFITLLPKREILEIHRTTISFVKF
jgi:hypothetical protein